MSSNSKQKDKGDKNKGQSNSKNKGRNDERNKSNQTQNEQHNKNIKKPAVTKGPPTKSSPPPKQDFFQPKDTQSFSSGAKYSKRKIESNVVRDELPEDIYDKIEETSRGVNVHELFSKPISIGDHFQFRLEKTWDNDINRSKDNPFFALDVDKISRHLSCIPFHKMIQLDESLFQTNLIESFEQTANQNRSKLFCKDDSPSEPNGEHSTNTIFNENIQRKTSAADVEEKVQMHPIELDELDTLLEGVKLTTTPKNTGTINVQSNTDDGKSLNDETQDKKDLEDWLDEFLDS